MPFIVFGFLLFEPHFTQLHLKYFFLTVSMLMDFRLENVIAFLGFYYIHLVTKLLKSITVDELQVNDPRQI